MSYDWEAAANREPEYREAGIVPEGTHQLTIRKFMLGRNNGAAFTDADGNPQILIIFADSEGNEATQMFTLDGDNAYHFARLCKAIGLDLAAMKAHNVTPRKFAEYRFAEAQLITKTRTLTADVKHTTKGDKTYANVYPRMPQPGSVSQSPKPEPAAVADSEIPF